MGDGDEITPRELGVIDERIEEVEDADRRYSTDEVVEELDIDLDEARHRRRFAEAVGAVACGYESLPGAADRRGVDAEDVARALSRHQYREDYDERLWADRHRDADLAVDRATQLDNDENLENINDLLDDLSDDGNEK